MGKEELFDKLREEMDVMAHINSAIGVLFWDQKVFMPPKGIEFRRSHQNPTIALQRMQA